eukprot:jgi/Mesen1/3273/ME000019S02688
MELQRQQQQQGQNIPEDDEFEQLLGEIPRATSAPPLLEELQKAYGGTFEDSPFTNLREDDLAIKPFTDIRLEDGYEEFYREYSGSKKLPPPMENRHLYMDLPSSVYSPKASGIHFSPFVNSLGLEGSPRTHAHPHQHQGQGQGHLRDEQSLSSGYRSQSYSEGPTAGGLSGASPLREDRRRGNSMGRISSLDSGLESMEDHAAHMERTGGSLGGFGQLDSVGPTSRQSSKNVTAGSSLDAYASAAVAAAYGGGNPGALDNLNLMQMGPGGLGGVGGQMTSRSGLEGYGLGGIDGLMGAQGGPAANAVNLQLYQQYLRSQGLDHMGAGGIGAMGGLAGGRGPGVGPRGMGMGIDALGLGAGTPLDMYSAAALQGRLMPQGLPSGGIDMYSAAALQQSPYGLADYDIAALIQAQHYRSQSPPRPSRQLSGSGSPPVHAPLPNIPHGGGGGKPRRPHAGNSAAAAGNQPSWAGGAGAAGAGGGGHLTGSLCKYFVQGFCSRGDTCPFPHSLPASGAAPGGFAGGPREPPEGTRRGTGGRERGGEDKYSSSYPPDTKMALPGARANSRHERGGGGGPPAHQPGSRHKGRDSMTNGHASNGHSRFGPSGPAEDGGDPYSSYHDSQGSTSPPTSMGGGQGHPKYTSLEEVEGQIYSIAKDQHGCRTRAVQKLIETLAGAEQTAMVIAALQPGVVTLIKDLNGNHFIYDAAARNCVEIATHRHGCCVLQRCIDFASTQQKDRLVAEVAANALVLSQDAFGNYVVQYILDLNLPWATRDVMTRLEGNYPHLSQQKFSSNVVEKCLKLSQEDTRARLVREMVASPRLGQLLQDPFANYVIQSALTVSKGPLHSALVEAIRPHAANLRSSPYGKRILSRTNLKK